MSYVAVYQVRSVKSGHMLVIDEADKAPTNVTCILKTLVESGEMHLSDGRRIVSGKYGLILEDVETLKNIKKNISSKNSSSIP